MASHDHVWVIDITAAIRTGSEPDVRHIGKLLAPEYRPARSQGEQRELART